MNDIGKNIKGLREERGFTQAQLAAMSDVDEKYISAIERGARRPGKKTIERMCEVFAVDEAEIRFGKRTPPEVDKDLQLLHENIERAFKAAQAVSDADKHEFMAKVLRMTKALMEEGPKG